MLSQKFLLRCVGCVVLLVSLVHLVWTSVDVSAVHYFYTDLARVAEYVERPKVAFAFISFAGIGYGALLLSAPRSGNMLQPWLRGGSKSEQWPIAYWVGAGFVVLLAGLRIWDQELGLKPVYRKEALAEDLTAAVAATAGAIALVAAWRHRRRDYRSVSLLVALIGMFFAGEEVSYGQRFFDYDSPDIFELHNLQQETNFHNFFNHIFTPTYYLSWFLLANVCVFYSSFLSFLVKSRIRVFQCAPEILFRPIDVLPIFVFAITTFAFQLYMRHTEYSEEVFSVLVCCLAARCLRTTSGIATTTRVSPSN